MTSKAKANEASQGTRMIPPDTETSRTIIVRLSARTHKALRVQAAEKDTSIQQWVERLIERELGINQNGNEK